MNIKEISDKKMSDKEFERKRKSGRLVLIKEEKLCDYDGNIKSRTEFWKDIKTKKMYKVKYKG